MIVFLLIGYFVGNFFGENDSQNETKPQMTFLTKEQAMELFENFEIIRFKEIEKDDLTGLGKMKHWHIFDVIAKKVELYKLFLQEKMGCQIKMEM